MSSENAPFSHLVEAATALASLEPGSSGVANAPSGAQPQQQQQQQQQHQPPPSVMTAPSPMVKQTTVASAASTKKDNAAAALMQRNKREIFPQKLMSVLNEPSLSDIISWLPHGKSFVIIRPDVFTAQVMPKYFPPVDAKGPAKYPSFTRKLNRWGFRQATRGPDTGAFHHALFLRDHPELCVDMVCQRSGSKGKQPRKSKAAKEAVAAAAAGSIKVAPLTKESLDRILPTPPGTTLLGKSPATVSVDNETQSIVTNSTSSAASSSTMGAIRQGISTDKAFVDMTIRQRDEMERMRVAQALLYKAFTSALQNGAVRE